MDSYIVPFGGPLSHSSIEAREYSIPAVMATGVATRRFQSRRMMWVEGTTSTVTLNYHLNRSLGC